MEYRTVRDAPTSELIKSLVGSYDTARAVRLGGQSCILAREETIAQEIDKRIPIPTAQPAPVSGWQPVESAAVGERVLVVCRPLPNVVGQFVAHVDDHGVWWTSQYVTLSPRPTHWMPLPEVPR